MAWVANLLPKEEKFFPSFTEHAGKLVKGAEVLTRLLSGGQEDVKQHCEQLNQIERDANQDARRILDAVRSTFVTPFNRVDIKSLITDMDSCLNDMRKAGRAVSLFEVREVDPPMRKMGEIIANCANLVLRAMPLLEDVDRRAGEITDLCRKITELQDESDEISEPGLRDLFKRQTNEPMAFLAQMMIYDHLATVMERFETIANDIHDIVIDQV